MSSSESGPWLRAFKGVQDLRLPLRTIVNRRLAARRGLLDAPHFEGEAGALVEQLLQLGVDRVDAFPQGRQFLVVPAHADSRSKSFM